VFEGPGSAETSDELYHNTWYIPYENKEMFTFIAVAICGLGAVTTVSNITNVCLIIDAFIRDKKTICFGQQCPSSGFVEIIG